MLNLTNGKCEVKCKCGERYVFYFTNIVNTNITKKINTAGWGILPTHAGEMVYVCPECHMEVIGHAKRIYELTGNKYVSLSNVIRKH